eukprot:scaffold130028_cov21-Tisochrysis_lutea.AAC.1
MGYITHCHLCIAQQLDPAVHGSASAAAPSAAGVDPVIVDEKGVELQGECEGLLMLRRPWPSVLRRYACE